MRGPGLTMLEAMAVAPQGRPAPQGAGIWSDEHVAPLRTIVEFAHSQGQKVAVQLAHAGRKASGVAPWLSPAATAPLEDGGWPHDVWGPSALKFSEAYPMPKALTREGIKDIVLAFAAAAERAVKAGFDVIEVHSGHGYLLHSFLSPVSNERTDEYGGSFQNRSRFMLEVIEAVRVVIPEQMPLFLR